MRTFTRILPQVLKIWVLLLLATAAGETCQAQSQIVVPYNQNWRFDQNDVDLGTAWRQMDYDDSGWPNGPGPLGFPVIESLFDGLNIQTVLNRFLPPPNETTQARTYYFRTTFVLPDEPGEFFLVASNLIDDGAVFFLNGVEIGRTGFGAGLVVTHGTPSSRFGEVASTGYDVFTNAATSLVQGTNVYAVEVHQFGSSSSDLVFATELRVNNGTFVPPLIITAHPTNRAGCAGGNIAFDVRAVGNEPLSYRWYFNGTNLLAGETNTQLNLVSLQTNQAGLYSAVVSHAFGSVTSTPAQLVVVDGCVGINLYAGLSMTGAVGRTYALESATNLAAINWALVATNLFTTPRWLFIDTNTPFMPGRFFRVRPLP